ncbi:MAG: PIN domain-containing protein [Candidatus Sulfotelmatobacter sp.]
MRLLLDTSVLIDALRLRHRRRELLAKLVQAGHTLATSALNIAEVYAGMRPDEAQRTEALLGALDCYELTGTSGRRAGAMKQQWSQKGRTLALADTIVAAIALERGCILMTDNRKDFPMEELNKFDPPER